MLQIAKLLVLFYIAGTTSAAILYPRPSEIREVISLNGLWNFALNQNGSSGINDGHLVPVPASYNDISPQFEVRDHVGDVWYQRTFYPPKAWKNLRVWLRFASVSYAARVSINGQNAVTHSLGHLPFEADITSLIKFGAQNNIEVVVNNTLNSTTLPQGSVQHLNSGRLKQTNTIDYFNYAGIDRSVVLYTTPQTHIDDLTVTTSFTGTTGSVQYVTTVAGTDKVTVRAILLDRDEKIISNGTAGLSGTIQIPNVHLWWPYLMDPNPGYLYILVIELLDGTNNVVDQYIQPVGVRTVTWDANTLNINNKPIYLRGFGRPEDSDFRGRGFDFALLARDYNLIKWIGTNTIRTSHQPLSEEEMDLADRLGILVINEVAADHTNGFGAALKANHIRAVRELYQRDKNRPSTIIWSVANEPDSQLAAAQAYFQDVFATIKGLDKTRPVLFVTDKQPDVDKVAQFADIIGISAYDGWETNTGDVDQILLDVEATVNKWRTTFKKPLIIAAYGSETQEGLHYLPTYVWSEDYQEILFSEYFRVFDDMKNAGSVIGELTYSFTDFRTDQNSLRLGGSKKGLFSRNRQPKESAYLIRKRYWALAEDFDRAVPPTDLNNYVHVKRSSVEL